MARLHSLLPGLLLTTLAAVIARLLASAVPLPPVFFALVIGMALGAAVPAGRLSEGIGFASKQVLRAGVALLGISISFAEITRLKTSLATMIRVGARPIIAIAITSSLLAGFVLSGMLLLAA